MGHSMKVMAAALLLGMTGLAHAGVAVVANPAVPSSTTEAEVVNAFMGKTKTFAPVDLEKWDSTKEGFYTKVVKRNENQLRSYWSSLIFTGKASPLPQVATDADVIKHVASNPNGLGYVDQASVTGDVKVLFTIP